MGRRKISVLLTVTLPIISTFVFIHMSSNFIVVENTQLFQPTCSRRSGYHDFSANKIKSQSFSTLTRDDCSSLVKTKDKNIKEHRTTNSINKSFEKEHFITSKPLNIDQSHSNFHLTNEKDFKIRDLLDAAHDLSKVNIEHGIKKYEWIYIQYHSVRALFEFGKLSNKMAINLLKEVHSPTTSVQKKKVIFDKVAKWQNKSVNSMCKILNFDAVPTFLYLQAGKFCLELADKLNLGKKVVQALSTLYKIYPKKLNYGSQLGLKLLLQLELDQSEIILRDVINRNNGLKIAKEKCLLGLCLKLQRHHKIAIKEKEHVVKSLVEHALEEEEGSLKLFNMIGTTFNRDRNYEDAEVVFDEGVRIGLFLSKWQRSSSKKDFRLKSLRGMPIWTPKQTSYHKALSRLQKNYQVIKQEGLVALFGPERNFEEEAENLREEGLWQQLILFETGVRSEKGCRLAPKTCKLILKYMKEISAECTHGQVKFSVIHSGTHVWPHSGPSNCRLRAHLGLVIPDVNDNEKLEIRIADRHTTWKEGQFLIIDDSFEHELWYQKKHGGIRLVLLIDMWHPDLTKDQISNIPPLINRHQNHSTIFTVSGIVDKISDVEQISEHHNDY